MRVTQLFFAGAGILAIAGVTAAAQAQHTPDQIVCQMTGSCGGSGEPDSARQIKIGAEKAFSLVRSTPAAPAHAAPAAPSPRATALATPSRRRAPAAPAAAPAGTGRMDMLVSFDFASANLTDQAKTEAKAFATAMAAPEMNGMRFVVEGHTDSIGSRTSNLDLSRRRAEAVVSYLVAQGADPSRLVARGYGFDQPRPGLTPADGANRRVEFVRTN